MNKDFLRFQENLKKTSFGLRFGKMLFTDPSQINEKNLTAVLRAMGLKIPKEIIVTHQFAQILATGGTVIDSFEALGAVSDAEKYQALFNASSMTIKLASELGKAIGMDETTTSQLNVANGVCRLFSSGFVDVGAWIQVAVEIANAGSKAQVLADNLARSGTIKTYQSMISNHTKNFTESLKLLSENKIGIFGFLTRTAQSSGTIFANSIVDNQELQKMFPGLNFIPVIQGSITNESGVRAWTGEWKYSTHSIDFKTIQSMSASEARDFMFSWVIEPYTYGYLKLNQELKQKEMANIFSLVSLAILENQSRFDQMFYCGSKLLKHRLTPHDLDDNLTIARMPNVIDSSGVKIGGISKDFTLTKDQANYLDLSGNIEILMKSKLYSSRINSSYTLPANFFPQMDTPAKIDWGKIENFVACLDYLDLVKNDPYFQNVNSSRLAEYFDFESLESWKKSLDSALKISTIRKVNALAKNNISYFLKTDINKLKRIDKMEIGQPAIFN